jgi:hypothetical protein
MIGLPFIAARESLPWPAWAMSTCASFWKIVATQSMGMLFLT